MVKKLLIVSMLLSSAAFVYGWNTTPETNYLVSGEGIPGQDLPVAVPGADGSTYISWLSWENQSASLKLQLLDKDGQALMDETGIYVSQFPTPTWSSGYGAATDSEGNVYLAYSDTRDGHWHTYVHKLSRSGEKLWGDGICVAETATEACLNPKVLLTDAGNIVVAYQSLDGSRNSIKISKLSSGGTKVWGGVIELTGTNGLYSLADAGNDSFYIVYIAADAGSVGVMRYTPNGEAAWPDIVEVDPGSAVVSSEPAAIAYHQGGVVVSWRHSEGMTKVSGAFQAVSRDGELLWDLDQYCPTPHTAAVSADGDIFVTSASKDESGMYLEATRYDSNGDYVWEKSLLLAGEPYQVSLYGTQVTDLNELVMVYRKASSYNKATIEYSHIDADGMTVDTEVPVSVMGGDKGHGSLSYGGGRQMVLVWGDNGMAHNQGSIYAQNIELSYPSSVTAVSVGSESLRAIYSHGELGVNRSGDATVSDCYGRVLFCGKVSEGATVSLPRLAPGIYILKVNEQSIKFTVI